MLTKLIRHEFRATSRIMWPIFAGMLALTLAMRASQNVLQNESPWLLNLLAVLVTIGFVFGIMALCFAPLVFLFCVLGVTAVSLIVYAAYAVGFSFNKHKSALTAVSVLVFFQLVQFAAIAVLANLFCDGFTAWSSLTGVQAGNAIFAVALVCELIVCVIFYLVTYFFLTRKLNLE